MRFINWNSELVAKTITDRFKVFGYTDEDKVAGDIAEALVRDHYKLEPKPFNEDGTSDEGYDMILTDKHGNTATVDVKAVTQDVYWFNRGCPSIWYIRKDKELIADRYLFVKIDTLNRYCALIGSLSREEIETLGVHYKKGDHVNTGFSTWITNTDSIYVSQEDLHPVF